MPSYDDAAVTVMARAKVQTDLAKARWIRSESEIFFDEAGNKLHAVAYGIFIFGSGIY